MRWYSIDLFSSLWPVVFTIILLFFYGNTKCLRIATAYKHSNVCLLFDWGFSSHSIIFHSYETSPLPAKGCKFWPMFGTHGQCAVIILQRAHPLWHGTSVYNGQLREPVTHTYFRAFSSGAVTTCFYELGLSRECVNMLKINTWYSKS